MNAIALILPAPASTAQDPLLDLIERYRVTGAKAEALCAKGQEKKANALWDPLHKEMLTAPAATTFEGVVAGIDWAIPQVSGLDLCGDGVLCASIKGLKNLVGGTDVFDPTFALIERHKELWSRVKELDNGVDDDPAWVKAVDAASEAMQAIADCEPTTIAGCRAAAVYIAEHPVIRGDFELSIDAFDTLARALKALVP